MNTGKAIFFGLALIALSNSASTVLVFANRTANEILR